MSIADDLAKVNQELANARSILGLAGTTLVSAMALATVMNNHDATVWQIVTAKRLLNLTRGYTAGTLAAVDQLNKELEAINETGS